MFKKIIYTLIVACLIMPCLALASPKNCKSRMAFRDEGMWPFNHAPKARLLKNYNFLVTSSWLEHVQQSSVHFRSGGSGSWVSPNGLVMTNYHVAIGALQEMFTSEHNYLEAGFKASTPEKELKIKDFEIIQLFAIKDVTARVLEAPSEAKGKVIADIEHESLMSTGMKSNVVSLYRGAKYHLYQYKRFSDVRLVFAPEKKIGSFGEESENFEYPRTAFDVAFFRVYENGKPIHPDHFFSWNPSGATEDDLVFISGNPGSTKRTYTSDHMVSDRDLILPHALELQKRRLQNLEAYFSEDPEMQRMSQTEYADIQNTIKVLTGEYQGLRNRRLNLIGRKRIAERKILSKINRFSDLESFATAWDDIKKAEAIRKTLFIELSYLDRAEGLNSKLFAIARLLVRLAEEDQKLNSERLPEYREENRVNLVNAILSPNPIDKDFEKFKLTDSLLYMRERIGPSHKISKLILQGKSPEEVAALMTNGTHLEKISSRIAYLKSGYKMIDESTDPYILLAKLIDGPSRSVRQSYEINVIAAEDRAYEKIAQAKFAVDGEHIYPDANGTPRLGYGRIQGYEIQGWYAGSHTTIGSTFESEKAHLGEPSYSLPESWHSAFDNLDVTIPLNQVSTVDIIGGSSGSPLLDRNAEIVGVIFDGNRESLVSRYSYSSGETNPSRAISVHSSGILEILRKIYGADDLASELMTGTGNK